MTLDKETFSWLAKAIFLTLILNVSETSSYVGYVVKVDVDKVFAREDFEDFATSEWSKDERLHVFDTGEEDRGHVLRPEVSMTGDEWGTLTRELELNGTCPEMARLSINFDMLVAGKTKFTAPLIFYVSTKI